MKKAVLVSAVLGLVLMLSLSVGVRTNLGTIAPFKIEDTLKVAAFAVLENHCNVCHHKKKPTYVFTHENMDAFAASINLEVFVTRKMPKGRDNDLSAEEEQTLKRWLDFRLSK